MGAKRTDIFVAVEVKTAEGTELGKNCDCNGSVFGDRV